MKHVATALLFVAALAGAGPISVANAQAAPDAALQQAIDAVAGDVIEGPNLILDFAALGAFESIQHAAGPRRRCTTK
ncbi:hypothetical protein [Sphingomonas sp. M1-B02]|uniref:hypothetical protein n=1 Tax=Sphingomonas sp. M1-B02 TaxID=3114300 RepID=UPI0022405A7F|nr:hypothetical protein [Sphingomonas sp. S6-11]UZK65457.1 hypothetical protein OKW87_13200 [Sphingomonas sp. S6-11]